MATLLSPDQINEKLVKLEGWKLSSGYEIQKKFTFSDFAGALAFVNRVGALAEGMEHHPDILLHGYKFVTLTLTTHEAKDAEGKKATGLTRMDFDFAEKLDAPSTIP